jgi:hypothetical protein
MPGYFVADFNGQVLMALVIVTQCWVLIVFVVEVTLTFLIPQSLAKWSTSISRVYLCLAGLALISHIKCAFTHPGRFEADSSGKAAEMCKVCSYPKVERVHHCKTCGVCILLMDHHCPFVNNCIGAGNHKFFLLFCWYTALSCLFTLCLAALTLGEALANLEAMFRMWVLLLGLCATCIAGFFFVLVSILLVRQVGRVLRNRTYIEELKSKAGPELTFVEALHQVFGRASLLQCLLPISPKLSAAKHTSISKVSAVSSKLEDFLIIAIPGVSLLVVLSLVYLNLGPK